MLRYQMSCYNGGQVRPDVAHLRLMSHSLATDCAIAHEPNRSWPKSLADLDPCCHPVPLMVRQRRRFGPSSVAKPQTSAQVRADWGDETELGRLGVVRKSSNGWP